MLRAAALDHYSLSQRSSRARICRAGQLVTADALQLSSKVAVSLQRFETRSSAVTKAQCAELLKFCQLLCNYSLTVRTRSSATEDGPRDALCQSKSCRLLDNFSYNITLYNKSTTNRSNGVAAIGLTQKYQPLQLPCASCDKMAGVKSRPSQVLST